MIGIWSIRVMVSGTDAWNGFVPCAVDTEASGSDLAVSNTNVMIAKNIPEELNAGPINKRQALDTDQRIARNALNIIRSP